jgi:hypothetical protein
MGSVKRRMLGFLIDQDSFKVAEFVCPYAAEFSAMTGVLYAAKG